MTVLTRRRYPGDQQVSRWTVRLGDVPANADAVVLLSIEELAVNKLRETFHRWVRTLAFPVRDGKLGKMLAHMPAQAHRGARSATNRFDRQRASDTLEEITAELRLWLREYTSKLTESLHRQLRPMSEPLDDARTNATDSDKGRCPHLSSIDRSEARARNRATQVGPASRKTLR